MIQDHNIEPARAWGHAGTAWDWISFGLSDAISHAVQCVWPEPGEQMLDIGTGTGWAARLMAGLGARTTGIDFSQGMVDAAKALSEHLTDRLTFDVAEAEALPFADSTFDGIVSTYGVMFTASPEAATAEMARVMKPGGRLALTTWESDPESYIPAFFALIGRYSDAPPASPSPMIWGDPSWLDETLGAAFDLHIEHRQTTLYAPNARAVWEKYYKGFGPMRLVADALPPDRLAAFRRDFERLHADYEGGNGLKIDRKALLVYGTRR